jgi:hypothetical protein
MLDDCLGTGLPKLPKPPTPLILAVLAVPLRGKASTFGRQSGHLHRLMFPVRVPRNPIPIFDISTAPDPEVAGGLGNGGRLSPSRCLGTTSRS